MNETLLPTEVIERKLKNFKLRIVLSIFVFIFCAVFGFLFLLFSPSLIFESDVIGPITLYISIIIFLTGLFALYFIGLGPRRIVFYYNRIKSLNLNHINMNSRYLISKKDELYIIYLYFANGIYFVEMNTTGGQSLLYRRPKKLPQFTIRLNKKLTIEDFTFRVGEFSGFFKIPLNKDEYVTGDAKVIFMPLATFSKSQGTTEKIHMMVDYLTKKPF